MAEKLYRVWDIKKQKYYSSGKKSIWKSETWAVNAVKDMWGDVSAKNFEIHEIEQVVAKSTNAHTLVQTAKDKAREKEMAKEEDRNVIRLIRKESDGLELHVVEQLYSKKRLIDSEMEKLRPLMEEHYRLQRIM